MFFSHALPSVWTATTDLIYLTHPRGGGAGGRLPGAINVPSEEWYEEERVDALVRSLKVRYGLFFTGKGGKQCRERGRENEGMVWFSFSMT